MLFSLLVSFPFSLVCVLLFVVVVVLLFSTFYTQEAGEGFSSLLSFLHPFLTI